MNCYEAIDVMGEAVEGRLEPELVSGFQEHVTECPPCGTYFEQLRLTRSALRRLASEGPPNPQRRKLIEAFKSRVRPQQD